MKIFARYLFIRLLVPFMVCLFSCTMIWVMIDLYGNVDDFLNHKVNFLTVLQFYSLQIPSMLVHVLPAAMLFSTLWTLLSLNRRSELVAFQSGGLSPLRLFSPFMVFAVIWVGVLAYDMYGPAATSQVTRERLMQQVKGQGGQRNVFQSLLYVDAANRREWTFQKLDLNQNSAERLIYKQINAQWNVVEQYVANKAKWTGSSWVLYDVRQMLFAPDGTTLSDKTFPEKTLDVSTPPSAFSLIVSQPDQLTVPQLGEYIETSNTTQENLAKYRTEWWYRILNPLSLIVLMMFALLQGLRTDRRSAIVGVVGAIVVLFLYILVNSIFISAGNFGRLPPVVAVAATPIIFGLLAIHLLALKYGWWWQVFESWRKRSAPAVANKQL